MRIDQILEERRPVFSFEFFPPKDKQGMTQLKGALDELAKDEPAYVSVTYGAGGSTRDRTISNGGLAPPSSAARTRPIRSATSRRFASMCAFTSMNGRPWPDRHRRAGSASTTSRLLRNSPAGSGV